MLDLIFLVISNIYIDLIHINWEALATIVAILACSITLSNLREEQKLSNKQVLFDKRLNISASIFNLTNCEKQVESIFTNKSNYTIDWNIAVDYLTRTSELQKILNAYDNPEDTDAKKKLLVEIQKLDETGYKSKLVFPNPTGEKLSIYFSLYGELLLSLYNYKIARYSLDELLNEKSIFQSPEAVIEAQNNVKDKYIEINNKWKALQKASKEIKLEEIDAITKVA